MAVINSLRRIAITGSRTWQDIVTLHTILDAWLKDGGELHVGDCPTGADRLAKAWAESRTDIKFVPYEADWEQHGNYGKNNAGAVRNRKMLDESQPMILIAFRWPGKSSGTEGCMKEAKARDIPILLIRHYGREGGNEYS